MSKILLFGEPLIRITPSHYEKLSNNVSSQIYYGGSEVNIARNMQGFGTHTSVFTAIPNDNIGTSFINFLNSNQIDTTSIQRCGDRLGMYYLINGYGVRNSEVYYDRKFTSINNIDVSLINFNQLFGGITHFHFSGITVAISAHVRNVLLVLLEEAKKRNIIVSMDLNLRTKMISIDDAKVEFSKFAKYADYCFGIDPIMKDENDINMFDRAHATDKLIEKRMMELQEKYHFKAVFHTLRNIDKNQMNTYSAYAYSNQLYKSISLQTNILERVGSGDAFVAGALYQIMNNKSLQDIIDFAVASGTLKCTLNGDNMYESKETVIALLNNQIDISR
ncbi:MAG: sugar kinase [Erysipelotrichales bacterium]